MTSHANRGLAQLVERHPYKVNVAGSTPVPPTIFSNLQFSDGPVLGIRGRAGST